MITQMTNWKTLEPTLLLSDKDYEKKLRSIFRLEDQNIFLIFFNLRHFLEVKIAPNISTKSSPFFSLILFS